MCTYFETEDTVQLDSSTICAPEHFTVMRVLSLSQAMKYAEMPVLSILFFFSNSQYFSVFCLLCRFWNAQLSVSVFLSPSPLVGWYIGPSAVHSGLPLSPVSPSFRFAALITSSCSWWRVFTNQPCSTVPSSSTLASNLTVRCHCPHRDAERSASIVMFVRLRLFVI